MPFSLHTSNTHFQVNFRSVTASGPQISPEGAKGSAILKCNIEIENEATVKVYDDVIIVPGMLQTDRVLK